MSDTQLNQKKQDNRNAAVNHSLLPVFAESLHLRSWCQNRHFQITNRPDAFLEQALYSWRREMGRTEPPLINVSEVCPPAPVPGNSVELGENRKR